jgi:hypothetical protein
MRSSLPWNQETPRCISLLRLRKFRNEKYAKFSMRVIRLRVSGVLFFAATNVAMVGFREQVKPEFY